MILSWCAKERQMILDELRLVLVFAIDVVPSFGSNEGDFEGSDADNRAILIVQLLDTVRELAKVEIDSHRKASDSPELGTRELSTWVEVESVHCNGSERNEKCREADKEVREVRQEEITHPDASVGTIFGDSEVVF
jgi:hypothetical protein